MANPALPNEFYAEALYECQKGFAFDPPDLRALFCAESEWIGKRPKCVPSSASIDQIPCNDRQASNCQQVCYLDDDENPVCGCFDGFRVDDDGFGCVDVDECAEDNGGCEDICVNKPGAFTCHCGRDGYEAQGKAYVGYWGGPSRCLTTSVLLGQ